MKLFIYSFFLLFTTFCFTQVNGLVQGNNGNKTEPLYGAKIKLLNTGKGVVTNELGVFEIILPKELPDTLVISARGYFSDTVIVDKKDRFSALNVILYSELLLPEVIIEFKRKTFSISRLKVLHVEELTSGELKKAACCNLGESFETNASVDVNMTDAVSGAKKIQMMGLDGVYTQIQFENIPYLRGLESSFGLESIPGSWIESIQITKGAGNVVNGYESMAGLINLEFEKPTEMDLFFINAYQNRFGRSEVNFRSGIELSEKWSTGIFGYVSSAWLENDENNDGFRDIPLGSNVSIVNRYTFKGDKMESKFGINAHTDSKMGGQMGATSTDPTKYGVNLNNDHIDLFLKTGFFGKKPSQSLGIISNLKYQRLDGFFGNRFYSGVEKRGYLNIIYDDYIGTTDHRVQGGASFTYIDITQAADSLTNNRIEMIPGVFGEYTYTGSRLTSVFGIRYDQHLLYGGQFSPRVHLKYKVSERTDLRITSGKGWRVPNYIIDNISLLANSFQWEAPPETKPEISWNIGTSLYQEFDFFKRNATLTIDFYRTWFENQLIIDRETDVIRFINQDGGSYSNAFQSELNIEISKRLEFRIAYKLLDVKATYGDSLQSKVMVPRHRGFMNLAYTTRNKRWDYDLTLSVLGKSRLSGAVNNENQYSKVFPRLNAQVTYKLKKWELYLGGENLTNYRQSNPIIEAANPFGTNFDATRVWGPVIGYNIYFGVRFAVKHKKFNKTKTNDDDENHNHTLF